MAKERDRRDTSRLLDMVAGLAEKAGRAIMEIYAGDDFVVSQKENDTPLTQADLAAHDILVKELPVITPDLPVLSEESADVSYETRRNWKSFWLVDPLDGTKEFLKRSGEFTVNIARIEEGFPTLGVIHSPVLGVTYYAMRGIGAFKKDAGGITPIHAEPHREGALKVVASRSHGREALEPFLKSLSQVESLDIGSSLKFCLVAEGTAHLYPRFGPTMEWDTAAGQCIVETAGGCVTDLKGNRLTYNKPDLHNPNFMVSGSKDNFWKSYKLKLT